PGLDTILLPTSPINEYADVFESVGTFGPDALPAIASPITIEGNGSIVGRSAAPGTPAMRIFFVKKGGALTLHDVTVRNGVGQGGGGGVLLEGTGASLVVDASRIVGNQATDFGGGIASGPPPFASDGNGGDITIKDSLIAGNAMVAGGVPGRSVG